jgi:hypothetical protein
LQQICISPEPWHPGNVDKTTQVTTGRSEVNYRTEYSDFERCHAAVLENARELVANLNRKMIMEDEEALAQPAGAYGPAPGRVNFEMVGADYMIDTNYKAWLLEVNVICAEQSVRLCTRCASWYNNTVVASYSAMHR